jgi:ATP-dependent helicase HrpA
MNPRASAKPPWRLEYPPDLPITARREEIVRAIREHPVVVLAGETGSGKTTQLPKLCLEAGRGVHGRIACTQPRRVAALSVSRRVAEELGVVWGREVGCKIRFDDRTSRQTVIKFLTDGMLLAEAQADRDLRAYDTVIVDEAHERSLNIDFLLGLLADLRHRRPELRVVITSATIDTAKFAAAFGGAPVLEVSGRLFPVATIYAPPDELLERDEELTRVDAAVAAVERIVRESPAGDVLVFLPTERDIRDAAELLTGRALGRLAVLPLFGRLTAAEQQRIFAPTAERKIVLATNIAETSLTIPGIRFVVDSGEARLSRYNSRTRTKRLPIEPVSQSSADQRQGRAGRVSEGVCVRLYSEEDYNRRPRYTPPEILRANLAEVILRMRAARLGDIETFPFVDPPPAGAIKAGYALLEELGALDSEHTLTPLGRELAALPVDPTVGRMLLQAGAERVVREALVVAAALSIQDPRERPLDQEAAADAAHRRFVHPDSDFLTLLAIWDAVHDQTERLSLGRLRKFCRQHFLSFARLREWRDIHAQLAAALGVALDARGQAERDSEADEEDDPLLAPPAATATAGPPNSGHLAAAPLHAADWRFGGERYRALHRSILTGLLANVAVRDQGNLFKATADRKVLLFPGSTLFAKPGRKNESLSPAPEPRSRGGRHGFWIVCGEVMETTRLYARTCARIDPLWILDIGRHQCRFSHTEPAWHPEEGRVLVHESVRLHGLEIRRRTVDYGRIDTARATEIFIRAALVADTLESPLPFLAHNRRVRAKVATMQTARRVAAWIDLDDALYRFYAARLEGVSSVHDLNRLWRERVTREPRFLHLDETDLLPAADEATLAAFPDEVRLDNRVLPLDYCYRPGAEQDGVTLRVPYKQAALVQPALLDWLVPGHLPEKIEALLRTLPKELRQRLGPPGETARAIAAELRADGRPLLDALADHLAARHRVLVRAEDWKPAELPAHLQVRVEVIDERGQPLAAGREVEAVRAALAAHERTLARRPDDAIAEAWRRARVDFERDELTDWTFGDLPPRVLVTECAGVPVHGYPALVSTAPGRAALRLCRTPEEAAALTPDGIAALLEAGLSRELAWLERDLRDLRQLGPAAVAVQSLEQWQADAYTCLRHWIVHRPVEPRTREAFVLAVATAREALKGIVWKLVDALRAALELRQRLLAHPTPYPELGYDLEILAGPGLLRRTLWPQVPHLPRYLRALERRADRWKLDPGKDRRRAQQVARWWQAVAELRRRAPASAAHAAAIDELRWMVEEYRVSLFAQDLGTARPVSEKKLEQLLAAARAAAKHPAAAPAPPAVSPPAPPPPSPPAKPTRLTSLSDLGRVLGR